MSPISVWLNVPKLNREPEMDPFRAPLRFAFAVLAADNYLGRLSDNYDGRFDCPLGPDVKRGGAPTGDRPQRAAA
jgi:hypothetical protein